MKNILRFSVATVASMLLIAVGVVVYMGCDGNAIVQAPETTYGRNLLEADEYRPVESATAAESSVVYFTKNITPEGLRAVYGALNLTPGAGAKVAVKLSTGEPPNSNYLRATLIRDFIQSLSPTVNIVECNTVYPGTLRGTTREHRQVIIDHGFAAIAPTVIMDSAGSLSIPVARVSGVTRHLDSNYVGKAFANYDYYVVLSHFKGHAMAGLGGAIKNISIGIGSTEGKCWIHTAGKSKTSFSGGAQNDFQESMAEAGKAVVDHLKNRNGKILYINVMNKLSIDCDCFGNPTAVDMNDIGILSSLDPVALDQACVDLVKKATDGRNLVNRMAEKNGYLMVSHGAKIGLGSQTYKVVNLDDNSTSIKIPGRQAPAAAAMCELRPK
ncbi:MAG: DUF362 domain-containing protein [Chitinispirillales bacterium]|jgi:uncharacterized Fe-S center protein|nr:DUF362 domain-containing protein [Chitinispirillales bacterium]